jgi:hypothetical protein
MAVKIIAMMAATAPIVFWPTPVQHLTPIFQIATMKDSDDLQTH